MSDVRSPRIEQLKRDLDAGPVEGVLARFWAEVALVGTPLVEACDDGHRQVTFLWRETEPVDRVVVIGGPALWWEIVDNQMDRLPTTDVWFRTYRARADLRGRYVLSPNDSLAPLATAGTLEAVERGATFVRDPFNREPFTLPGIDGDPVSPEQRFSTFALDQASPRPYAAPRVGVPRGIVTATRLASVALGNERRVWLYRSAGAQSPRAVLVLLDGRDWAEALPIFPTLDNLVAEGLLPPLVAVLPDSIDFATRATELPCNEAFSDFLADELVPWAAREAGGAITDPRRTVIAGKSYGGLASVFAALRHPDVFGTAIAQSSSFWWSPPGEDPEWLLRQVGAMDRLDARFCLNVGLQEGDWMIPQTQRLAAALTPRATDVLYREYNGGHDITCWLAELPAELRWAYNPLNTRDS